MVFFIFFKDNSYFVFCEIPDIGFIFRGLFINLPEKSVGAFY